MINMVKLGYRPNDCCWVHKRGQAQGLLAVYVPPFTSSPWYVNDAVVQMLELELSGCTMHAVTANLWWLLTSCIDSLFTS
jgi:hypothetical protein